MLQVSAGPRSYCRLWLRLYLNHTEINMYLYIRMYNTCICMCICMCVYIVSFRRHHRFLAAFKKAEKHVCCTAKQIDKTNKVESKCGRMSVCVRLLLCVCVCVCCCCVGFKAVIMCSQSVRQGDNSSAL